jgi:hypothetical protein
MLCDSLGAGGEPGRLGCEPEYEGRFCITGQVDLPSLRGTGLATSQPFACRAGPGGADALCPASVLHMRRWPLAGHGFGMKVVAGPRGQSRGSAGVGVVGVVRLAAVSVQCVRYWTDREVGGDAAVMGRGWVWW